MPGLPQPPNEPEPLRLGGGRYELRGLLGRGASGEVHRALDRRTGSEVAVKILRKADAEEIYQLKREFRALADVRHDGVARLYDLHIDGTQCFFSMQLVRGVDIIRYVEEAADERAATLASLLPHLVGAIRAVHALGIVHRDLKPENILIERREDGPPKVVLLDFGLLAPLLPDARDAAALAGLTGTIAYMAPEQLWGKKTTEATDWYALGGLLFHALFGHPPFAGSAVDVATAKSTGAAVELLPGDSGPEWLVTLILEMLADDPADRPSGEDMEVRVGAACGNFRPAGMSHAAPLRRAGGWSLDAGGATTSFFGRDAEMAALHDAFDRSRTAGLTLARISGPSGIGKSELLRRFSSHVESECGAVVLRGRCHPYESIPRKGLDQVVDDLSRYLQLDETSCTSLRGEEAGALCQLFPVLGRVDALSANARQADTMDPQMIRQVGMDAFARILATIAGQRPLVVWIDDVQWSDDESAAVLGSFLRSGRDGRGLVMLSYRPEAEGVSAMLASTEELSQRIVLVPRIDVPPLEATAARRFVDELVGTSALVDADAVVAEAAGSPFFLAELVRSVRASAERAPGRDQGSAPGTLSSVPRVGEVVALRYRALQSDARAVMDVLALAGAPLREDTSVAAAGTAGAWQALGELERECLVRSIETPQGRRVQPYHDRIAEGVRGQFDLGRRSAIHGELIEALEQEPETDHELLVYHCSEAAQMTRAARHAGPAARKAADTLAFDRAGELYRFALEHGDAADDKQDLRFGLAESLANAGRGEEAAAAFEQAAREHPAGVASAAVAIDLRRRSAEQLLRCGRIDEGIARMREVLACFGERLPASSGEAMRSFLWQRLRLLARGTRIRPGIRTLDDASAARLDAMWSTTIAVSMIDVGLAGAVQVRHFHDALDFADPDRLALALAHEATWRSCLGPRMRRSASEALEEARRLAGQHGRSYPEAWTSMADGIVRWQSGRFADAVPCLDTALEGYRHGCKGVFFEIALTAMYQFAALALAGRVGRLATMVESEAEAARRRRDRFAHHGCLMGEAVHARLAADEPERALAEADAAIAEWPQRDFLMPHYQHLLATVQADLYRGDPDAAWMRLDRAWRPLSKAGYLWLECPSLGLTFLRARAALGRVARSPDIATRAALIQVASTAERRIRRSHLRVAEGFAATIRAGLQSAAGNARATEVEVRAANAAYRIADMRMHAASCDWTLRRLADPTAATGDGSYAEEWAREEGWRNLDRLADSLVPLPGA